ncbi:helix-turn-helix transcriptional regulator [Bartonella sp. HY329]|uniref:winged helix-turn-helix transcriptional regulator n=1 Tax=unclassified Bartonella TaxID=2645622 RepID=UPI0021C86E65|nr:MULTISPECIES: helix-turn-helix domain-containing protein [unclassified Bartonella]UXM94824.1 helix-turn-helix transcriptional regulator [Bartonella sp. HY329]UXN09147.1 helix-turn-helix transcriptional regulator [Bartonella sp. HY328]
MKIIKSECSVVFNNKKYPCPISMGMDVIGGRWKGVILYYLMEKDKRYSELKRDMPSITEMTLSLQLKKLEKDGLITRHVEGVKPPLNVTYSLTSLGKSLETIFQSIADWSKKIAENNTQ